MKPKKDSYHHGDLRQALLTAGLALLEEHGLPGLTLRRAAAVAGVSHAAPAHYFPSLKALLTAIAAIGFERFGAAMAAERTKEANHPAAQMRAAGQGYVNFAIANPGLFRLMFSETLLDWSDIALREAARASFQQLEEIIQPVAAGKATALGDRTEILKLVWCVVHGYAHLYLEGQMQWADAEKEGEISTPRPPDIAALLMKEERV
jgi:AcrR family transcriptional regulator